MNDFAEPWWDLNIIGENDPNKNDYEPAYSPDNDPYYTIFGDDDDDSSSSSSSSELTQVKLPRTYEKSLITTVGVSSGQTVVLGGMLENSKSKTVKQVPILGDIPLIGWLFRHTETTYMPTNLLIFVTTRIVDGRGREMHKDGLDLADQGGDDAKPAPEAPAN